MIVKKIDRTPWDACYEMFKDYVDYVTPDAPPQGIDEAKAFKLLVSEKCAQLNTALVEWYWDEFEQEWCNDIRQRYAFATDLNHQLGLITGLQRQTRLQIFNLQTPVMGRYDSDLVRDGSIKLVRFPIRRIIRLMKLRGMTLSEYVFGESFPCPITSVEYALIREAIKLPLSQAEALKDRLSSIRSPLEFDMGRDPELRKKVTEEKCVQKWVHRENPILPRGTHIYNFTSRQGDYDVGSGMKRFSDYANQKKLDNHGCMGIVHSVYSIGCNLSKDFMTFQITLPLVFMMSIYSGMPLECFCSEAPRPQCDEYYFLNRHTGEAMFLEPKEKEWLKLFYRIPDDVKMNLLIALVTKGSKIFDFSEVIS